MTYQRESKRRVRLAIVGVGSHCYRNILPVLNYLPVQLVAICDIDDERAELTARQYGAVPYQSASAMYAAEDLDAVVLAAGPRLHPDLAVEAFEAGLHVWLEKPPAARVRGVEEMLQARGDRVCVVGFKKMFMPATRKAAEIIEHVGAEQVRSLLGVYSVTVEDRAFAFEHPEASNWLDDGCHPLSLLVALGGQVDAVTVIRGDRGGGACLLEFSSGVVGNLHLGEGAPLSQPFEYYGVFGDGWRIDVENCVRARFQRGVPFDYERATSFAPPGLDHGAIVWEAQSSLATLENKAFFVQGIYGELAHFLECVLESRQAELGTLEHALQVMQIYEAALASAGARVELSTPSTDVR